MVASKPLSKYANTLRGALFPVTRARITAAAKAPSCRAAGAIPGTGSAATDRHLLAQRDRVVARGVLARLHPHQVGL